MGAEQTSFPRYLVFDSPFSEEQAEILNLQSLSKRTLSESEKEIVASKKIAAFERSLEIAKTISEPLFQQFSKMFEEIKHIDEIDELLSSLDLIEKTYYPIYFDALKARIQHLTVDPKNSRLIKLFQKTFNVEMNEFSRSTLNMWESFYDELQLSHTASPLREINGRVSVAKTSPVVSLIAKLGASKLFSDETRLKLLIEKIALNHSSASRAELCQFLADHPSFYLAAYENLILVEGEELFSEQLKTSALEQQIFEIDHLIENLTLENYLSRRNEIYRLFNKASDLTVSKKSSLLKDISNRILKKLLSLREATLTSSYYSYEMSKTLVKDYFETFNCLEVDIEEFSTTPESVEEREISLFSTPLARKYSTIEKYEEHPFVKKFFPLKDLEKAVCHLLKREPFESLSLEEKLQAYDYLLTPLIALDAVNKDRAILAALENSDLIDSLKTEQKELLAQLFASKKAIAEIRKRTLVLVPFFYQVSENVKHLISSRETTNLQLIHLLVLPFDRRVPLLQRNPKSFVLFVENEVGIKISKKLSEPIYKLFSTQPPQTSSRIIISVVQYAMISAHIIYPSSRKQGIDLSYFSTPHLLEQTILISQKIYSEKVAFFDPYSSFFQLSSEEEKRCRYLAHVALLPITIGEEVIAKIVNDRLRQANLASQFTLDLPRTSQTQFISADRRSISYRIGDPNLKQTSKDLCLAVERAGIPINVFYILASQCFLLDIRAYQTEFIQKRIPLSLDSSELFQFSGNEHNVLFVENEDGSITFELTYFSGLSVIDDKGPHNYPIIYKYKVTLLPHEEERVTFSNFSITPE